jgi:hypothetical protein
MSTYTILAIPRETKPEQCVFTDKLDIEINANYEYGYSPKGTRCYGMKSGKRGKRISMIGAWRDGAFFAPPLRKT